MKKQIGVFLLVFAMAIALSGAASAVSIGDILSPKQQQAQG